LSKKKKRKNIWKNCTKIADLCGNISVSPFEKPANQNGAKGFSKEKNRPSDL